MESSPLSFLDMLFFHVGLPFILSLRLNKWMVYGALLALLNGIVGVVLSAVGSSWSGSYFPLFVIVDTIAISTVLGYRIHRKWRQGFQVQYKPLRPGKHANYLSPMVFLTVLQNARSLAPSLMLTTSRIASATQRVGPFRFQICAEHPNRVQVTHLQSGWTMPLYIGQVGVELSVPNRWGWKTRYTFVASFDMFHAIRWAPKNEIWLPTNGPHYVALLSQSLRTAYENYKRKQSEEVMLEPEIVH